MDRVERLGGVAALWLAAVLIPPAAWLGPLAMAPIAALGGLMSLPALRITSGERLVYAALAGLCLWAAFSTAWSVYTPEGLGSSTALKLVLQLPLYAALWSAARRAPASTARRAARALALGLGGVAGLLLIEAATGAAIYRALRILIDDPIRPDLGRKNVAQAAFVLAVLWGPARAACRDWTGLQWLPWLIAGAVAGAAIAFDTTAPLVALALAVAIEMALARRPRAVFSLGPWILAALALLAPFVVRALEALGLLARLHAMAPASWAQRLDYWTTASAHSLGQPWLGLGLDASRAADSGVGLHPHNLPLQIWLELGAPGALLLAAFWVTAWLGLQRAERPGPLAAVLGAHVCISLVSFGAWQEWWIALGAMGAALTVAAQRTPTEDPQTRP